MDDELEQIRKKRMMELQNQLQAQQQEQQVQQQVEQQKKAILKQILTPEARSRLANVSLAKPEYAQNIENQLIQLAQMGRLQSQITDAQLKDMLATLTKKRRETKIERK